MGKAALLLTLLASSLMVAPSATSGQFDHASVSLSPTYQELARGETTTLTAVGQSTIGGLVYVNVPGSLDLVGDPTCSSGCRVPFVTEHDNGTRIDFNIDDEMATMRFTVAVGPSAPAGTTLNLSAYLVGGPDAVEMSTAMIVVRDGPMDPTPSQVQPASESTWIQVTKKRCAERPVFPVFVESHCTNVPEATFTLMNPTNVETVTLSSGEQHIPADSSFAGSNLWSLEDNSRDASMTGVRVVSCLASRPDSDWHSSVLNVIHPDDPGSVLLDWMFESTGNSDEAYQPSLDCLWLELPELGVVPAILSLQVFTTATPYLHWTESTGQQLPESTRGESGEDLEASMVMTNVDTGEVYSFAADAYGQVLVPAGTYSLVETASGLEQFFSMYPGQTTLVEVGLANPASGQNAQGAVETRTFTTGTLYCDGETCSPVEGATIYYESINGAVSGSCVTEIIDTPNGQASWCEYEYVPGVPTILTLDESTLPAGLVVTSENPQTYLVPENPDGPLGPVYFELAPT